MSHGTREPKATALVTVPQSKVSEIRQWLRETVLGKDIPEYVSEMLFSLHKELGRQ